MSAVETVAAAVAEMDYGILRKIKVQRCEKNILELPFLIRSRYFRCQNRHNLQQNYMGKFEGKLKINNCDLPYFSRKCSPQAGARTAVRSWCPLAEGRKTRWRPVWTFWSYGRSEYGREGKTIDWWRKHSNNVSSWVLGNMQAGGDKKILSRSRIEANFAVICTILAHGTVIVMLLT